MKTFFCILAVTVLSSACAGLSAGSTDRPNRYQDLQGGQRELARQDPYNHLEKQTQAVELNPEKKPLPKTCTLPCAPGEHCNAEGPVERCVADKVKP